MLPSYLSTGHGSQALSQERLQEYVHLLLIAGGSKETLRQISKGIEILHLAPQIGTIYLGNTVEEVTVPMVARKGKKEPPRGLHLYKVEDFNNEWTRLSQDSEVSQLALIYRALGGKDVTPHPTSKDPLKTSFAAKSFLSYASIDAYNMFFSSSSTSFPASSHGKKERLDIPPGETLDSFQQKARVYLTAICRYYLTDYICAGYELPADCAFLLEEVELTVKEYNTRSRKEESAPSSSYVYNQAWKYLKQYLPQWVLRLAADLYCFGERAPDCAAAFVHEAYFDEDSVVEHDEL